MQRILAALVASVLAFPACAQPKSCSDVKAQCLQACDKLPLTSKHHCEEYADLDWAACKNNGAYKPTRVQWCSVGTVSGLAKQ